MSNPSNRFPTIIIEMDGGLIQSIKSSHPVRVVVLDGDVEGSGEDEIVEIDGCDVIVSDHESIQRDPVYVLSVVNQIDALVRNDVDLRQPRQP